MPDSISTAADPPRIPTETPRQAIGRIVLNGLQFAAVAVVEFVVMLGVESPPLWFTAASFTLAVLFLFVTSCKRHLDAIRKGLIWWVLGFLLLCYVGVVIYGVRTYGFQWGEHSKAINISVGPSVVNSGNGSPRYEIYNNLSALQIGPPEPPQLRVPACNAEMPTVREFATLSATEIKTKAFQLADVLRTSYANSSLISNAKSITFELLQRLKENKQGVIPSLDNTTAWCGVVVQGHIEGDKSLRQAADFLDFLAAQLPE